MDEVGKSISWREAIALVSDFQNDDGTRLHAALRGWSYPMSRTEFYLNGMFTKLMNMLRPEGSEPLSMELPMKSEQDLAEEESALSDDESRELMARWRASSAFPHMRQSQEE